MTVQGPGAQDHVCRAVEEPLEAAFDLGEDIQTASRGLRTFTVTGIAGSVLLLVFLLPSLYSLTVVTYRGLMGRLDLTSGVLPVVAVSGVLVIILAAVIVTTIMYLVQVHKYNSYLLSRHTLVNDLKAGGPDDGGPGGDGPAGGRGVDKRSMGAGRGRHHRNPIFAMIDLVEESMHELPQMLGLLRFAQVFIAVDIVFLAGAAAVQWGLGEEYIFELSAVEWAFGIAALVLILPSLVMFRVHGKRFRNLKTRHDIIDAIRFRTDLRVPGGKGRVDRLIRYLEENDPYVGDHKGMFDRGVTVDGESGETYFFDARLTAPNTRRELSRPLGIPGGRFTVLIRTYDRKMTRGSVEDLAADARDVCARDGAYLLRVIALQRRPMELPEDAYEYVLREPIVRAGAPTHLEVVSEDGDVYSFIPMISYGKTGGGTGRKRGGGGD